MPYYVQLTPDVIFAAAAIAADSPLGDTSAVRGEFILLGGRPKVIATLGNPVAQAAAHIAPAPVLI
ncbi:hypothetical protein R70006_06265 [Paraburkholderia domus]|uniref:hypothetical protein n=1 Tax=Paraburkholderia domus TaxID=2793075 RepID=UPI0019140A30|nr:hypothetical protein [Paraburkholderia domus]MBK5052896.1 hypothetical protein [Burkholderia sp. R-70006]CAE6822394.1 hypothetical protein R70006_06265 [Paraburkholderia domus]